MAAIRYYVLNDPTITGAQPTRTRITTITPPAGYVPQLGHIITTTSGDYSVQIIRVTDTAVEIHLLHVKFMVTDKTVLNAVN